MSRKEHYRDVQDIVTALHACNEYMSIMRNDMIQLANRFNLNEIENKSKNGKTTVIAKEDEVNGRDKPNMYS
jgi:hypothetical protein